MPKIARNVITLALGAGLVLSCLPIATDASAAPRYRSGGGAVVRHVAPRRVFVAPRRHFVRRVGPVIALGVAGAYYAPRYYSTAVSCSELEYRCDRGDDWACHRLDVIPYC